MKSIQFTLLLVCLSFAGYTQVGIGTTDPKASLDISSSNITNPSSNDGLLIPKIDNFPSTNPGPDQDGMMVFVTGNGAPTKGFFYWDNGLGTWVSVRGSEADADFYEIGTSSNPDAITDDIYTLGKLKIGQNSTASSPLSIHDWNANNSISFSISRSLNTASTNGQFSGSFITLDAQTSDNYFGYQSTLSGNIQAESANYYAQTFGNLNSFTNLFSGRFYSASGNGRLYGANINYLTTVTNTGNKYGFNVDIPSSLPGTHYGLYSNVQSSSGYAAYLIGRTSLGHSTANRYIMPSVDGSTGQVMTTDGLGNISFETPVSGAERINDLLDAKSDNDGSDDGSSLFLGIGAGANDDSTHNYNIGIGFQALQSNISSWGNTAIGHQAMQASTSGMNNTATGAFSLTNNNSGVDNAAFGNATLGANSIGSFNSAIGHASLNSNTNGNYNTALGYWTLLNNDSGSRNVALGSSSGYTNSTGSDNVFLGYQSGYFETGSEKLYIENSNSDSNNALIYGEFDNNILRTNGEFQIGNPSTTGYAFPTSDGTSGQVMTTDGAGNVSFQTIVGDGTGTDNQNLTPATLTGTILNLGIQNGTGTLVDLTTLQDGNTQNTLDQAYDEGGIGNGRTINATDGALRINGDDGFLVTGTAGSGNTIDSESTGAGTRMFFNPRKGAFRTGRVDANQWDDANIGFYSFAVGENTIASSSWDIAMGLGTTASGGGSIALGNDTVASGLLATAIGDQNIASGDRSLALGSVTTASGNGSTAMGSFTIASGNNSFALGTSTTSASFSETSIGIFNTNYTPNNTTAFNASDRLFVVGNGMNAGNRSNALTIFKSGLMNINDEYNMPLTDGTTGQVMTTDGGGNITFQTPAIGVQRINDLLDGKTDTSNSSLFLGIGAGFNDDDTTNFNVGIGSQALLANTSGDRNTGVGVQALRFNTSGINNNAFGVTALWSNTTGNGNSAFGNSALFENISGNQNTAVGISAGSQNTIGDGNVFLGFSAGFNETGSNKLYIANSGVGENAALIYGEFDSAILRTNGQFQIRNPALNGYAFPLIDGTASQILATNGAGQLLFVNSSAVFTDNDNQQIDTFSFNSTTYELTLELEDDGQPAQIVNFSSLNPQKAIARLFMSASQTETGSGLSKVNFDSVEFDIGNNFNTTTDEFVVPQTGIYSVTTQITMDASTGIGTFDIRIRVNGTQQRRAEYNHTGNGQILRQITSILSLTAGDTIDIAFSRPAIGATIQANSRASFFEIEQLQ